MSTTTTQPAAIQSVLDALANLHTETDRWTLADALLAAAPQNAGNGWFDQMVKSAETAGVPCPSHTTLRKYRDTAAHWPKDKRVEGASFTAHREVEALGPVDKGVKLLEQLIDSHGAKGVKALTVRNAVLAAQGKAIPVPANKAKSSLDEAVKDLLAGGKGLIDVIKGAGDMNQSTLDKLAKGLSAVQTEVDGLRVKAAAKAGAAAAKGAKAKAAPAAQPVTPVESASPAVPAAPAVGDLKGL